MKRVFVGTLLSILWATAQSADWIELASTDKSVWEGRAGTRAFSTTRGGKKIVAAEGRVTSKQTNQITFSKWYVEVDHCRAGYGKVVTVSMDGDFKFDNEFVLNGGTVASSLAEMLCYAVAEADKRGI